MGWKRTRKKCFPEDFLSTKPNITFFSHHLHQPDYLFILIREWTMQKIGDQSKRVGECQEWKRWRVDEEWADQDSLKYQNIQMFVVLHSDQELDMYYHPSKNISRKKAEEFWQTTKCGSRTILFLFHPVSPWRFSNKFQKFYFCFCSSSGIYLHVEVLDTPINFALILQHFLTTSFAVWKYHPIWITLSYSPSILFLLSSMKAYPFTHSSCCFPSYTLWSLLMFTFFSLSIRRWHWPQHIQAWSISYTHTHPKHQNNNTLTSSH